MMSEVEFELSMENYGALNNVFFFNIDYKTKSTKKTVKNLEYLKPNNIHNENGLFEIQNITALTSFVFPRKVLMDNLSLSRIR